MGAIKQRSIGWGIVRHKRLVFTAINAMGDYSPGYMENHERRLLPVSVEKLKNIHQMNWGLISSFKDDKTKVLLKSPFCIECT